MSRADFSTFEAADWLARKRLPRSVYKAVSTGAGRDLTRRWNVKAFEEICFRPRAATVVKPETIDLSVSVLGTNIAFPVLVTPTGGLRVLRPEGVCALARAATAAGTICAVSSMAGHAPAEVARATSGPLWFQLYHLDRTMSEQLIDQAAQLGYKALMVTVDCAIITRKETIPEGDAFGLNLKSALRYGPELAMRPGWTLGFLRDGIKNQLAAAGEVVVPEVPPTISATWDDFGWIREQWRGPLVIKGVLTTEDARRAVDVGADAISVSNHGGFALDGLRPSIHALAEIVHAVGARLPVLVDSGVRHGSDVAKALALGARAVLVGRPMALSLGAAGEAGARRMLHVLRHQLDDTLALLGCPSVQALDRSYIDAAASSGVFGPSSLAGSPSIDLPDGQSRPQTPVNA